MKKLFMLGMKIYLKFNPNLKVSFFGGQIWHLNIFFLISGKQIGDRNIFEVRSRLQGDITVQNGCVFGSKTVYTQPGAIPDKTVIYTQVTHNRLFSRNRY